MNAPNVPNLQITGSPALDGLITKAIMSAGAAIVTWSFNKLNIHSSDWSDWATSMVIGGLLMSAASIYGWFLSKVNQAKAVQSGINLAVSGNAVAEDGKTVITQNNGGTPPKPVDLKTAPVIAKNFGAP